MVTSCELSHAVISSSDLIHNGVESLNHVNNLEIGILKSKNRDCFVWGADEHVQRFPIQSDRTVTFITEHKHIKISRNLIMVFLLQTPEKLTERQVPC